MNLPPTPSVAQFKSLAARSGILAALQVLQISIGLISQVILLVRWSPHDQIDLFLLFSSIPWLVSAALLLGGLEIAMPAAYHRAAASDDEHAMQRLIKQLNTLTLIISLVAALFSGAVVGLWAIRSELGWSSSIWMGIALGMQVVPASLGGLWRGLLISRDQLIRARLTLLSGSLLIAIGYAFLPGPPVFALPLAIIGSAAISSWVAWWFCKDSWDTLLYIRLLPLEPVISDLIKSLGALGVGAGVVHLQTIVERAAALSLGTGNVTAAAIAGRGWEAVMAAIVAASITAVYPRWAQSHAQGDQRQGVQLLRWSLLRAVAMSIGAAVVIGFLAWAALLFFERQQMWIAGSQVARFTLALLPRFVLLCSVQPLVLKHYAQGITWPPIVGAALGLGVCAIGMWVLVPVWGLMGFAFTVTASVLPGLLYLSWREWRMV